MKVIDVDTGELIPWDGRILKGIERWDKDIVAALVEMDVKNPKRN